MLRLLSACLLILALLAGFVQADQHQKQSAFEAGVEAFETGNLELARRKFEQARAEGVNTPSLLYNLGVVYFRLEQHEDAKKVFRLLLDSPHAPLAQYNLGLVFLEQGDAENARLWFLAAADEISPEKVRALAVRRLQELDSESPDSVPDDHTSAYLSFYGGHNNNIAGTPDEVSSNRVGAFADVLAAGRYKPGGDPGQGLRLNGLVYTRQYPSDADFDNSFASVGAAWLARPGPGDLTSTLSAGHSWFGSETLERQVQFDVVYRLGNCPSTNTLGDLECEFSGLARAISGGSGFSAYDGELFRAGLKVTRSVRRWQVSGSYSLESDHRRDLATAQEFYSLSPVRHLFLGRAQYQWSPRLGLGLSAGYRLSRYRDSHRLITSGEEISER